MWLRIGNSGRCCQYESKKKKVMNIWAAGLLSLLHATIRSLRLSHRVIRQHHFREQATHPVPDVGVSDLL